MFHRTTAKRRGLQAAPLWTQGSILLEDAQAEELVQLADQHQQHAQGGNEFDAEVLFVPCATDGTLDVLRTKITEFCNAMSFEGKPKIVILDEVDSASQSGQNNFQMALRTLIEAAQDDTRFMLTCNMKEKVLPAVISRCPIVPLRFDKKDLLFHIKKILDSEKIEYTKESLKAFIEEAFRFYPDCRRIVKYL